MTVDIDHLVRRPVYDALLRSYLGVPLIKVLTGVRRCGKSSLLKMLAADLAVEGVPATNLLYLSLEGFDVPLQPTAEWLDEMLRNAFAAADPHHRLYVFIDEVQEVPGWERVVRRLHAQPATDVYLTGSNAFMLSTDLSTYLSGRYVEIPVFPLSLGEYSRFAEELPTGFAREVRELDDAQRLALYLRYGGMPVLFTAASVDEATVLRELTAVHDTVLLNDVAKRFGIRDIALLEKIVRYVYSTSGNLFSVNRVAGFLTSAGRKTSAETVESYLDALRRAFLVYPCEEHGLAGKRVLQPQRKFYAPDTGLRNREIGFAVRDVGFQLEGVVHAELLRRGFRVSVGKLPAAEVDFVAERGPERLYVQVCDSLLDDRTRERELAPLEAVHDSFPKLLLTRDPLVVGLTSMGIRVQEVGEWLLGE